ncbi:NAD(P)/FAD-dependent oxidoreductase [Hydrogenophaga sp. SL48]|uniref:NAD(P)/FAD-dependent oxidoreductase n=1 Tax=Hydrogenophaga sp. SL48 TaxID=2806347 RepID=UPI001F3B33F7|nr:FAD-dependent oxidoreductase [Hydrogenophaga sp. SL48]UJW81287.1 FAD-binding oxidoreductase [Hydrogenophaga sp. SL48]
MTSSTDTTDFIVIGAGIAGASVAHWLAPHGRVTVLEREPQPGYHSTGRSAALYMASYGSAQVRALTRASLAFFDAPPAGFSEHPLLSPRGAMMVATEEQMPELEAHWAMLAPLNPQAVRLTGAQACERVPALRPDQVAGAVYEPDAADMDVHAIHGGFLRGVRRHGGEIVCDAAVTSLHRVDGLWQVDAAGRRWQAPVVINAAGAWADAVGQMAGARAIGLVPKRRSAFVFHAPKDQHVAHWPLVFGAAEDWYIKPDAGVLLGSPANADPVPPQDVQPEELDIAMAIHRIGEMTTLEVNRPIRTWAGLRSFVEDGGLVGGFDPLAEGFFWVAAQGGYGIQTAPAMGEACAALARGLPIPAHIAAEGLDAAQLGPARLHRPQSA